MFAPTSTNRSPGRRTSKTKRLSLRSVSPTPATEAVIRLHGGAIINVPSAQRITTGRLATLRQSCHAHRRATTPTGLPVTLWLRTSPLRRIALRQGWRIRGAYRLPWAATTRPGGRDCPLDHLHVLLRDRLLRQSQGFAGFL